MTLFQMQLVLEIYKCGSMNRAAQNLFISQSAVSTAIRELEEELGITVFHRTNRGITLTDDGEELVGRLTPIVEQSRLLKRRYDRGGAERVHLAISAQRYPFCAKAFVDFLHERNDPRITVSLKETDMSSVIDDVARQESDLGILFLSDVTEPFMRRVFESRNLTFTQIAKLRPHVFLRKGHPLSGAASLTPRQIKAYPYVMFTRRENNLNYAEEAMGGTGADFDQVVYVNDRATAYNVMAHTNCLSTGSGVMPEGYGDERIMAIPLSEFSGEMRLGFICIKGIPMSEPCGRFVELLDSVMKNEP